MGTVGQKIPRYTIELLDIEDEGPSVRSFRMPAPYEDFSYSPGQFIEVGLPEDSVEKAFSLSSSPTEGKTLQITVELLDSGELSPDLFQLQAGDRLKIHGPYGIFRYEEGMADRVVLIAGGTGIAPIRAMMRYIADRNLPVDVTLLYSARTPAHLLFYDELVDLDRRENFKVHLTVTRDFDHAWDGPRGRINRARLEETIAKLDALFYLCGPAQMNNDLRQDLLNLGVDRKRIKMDRWGLPSK